jgi:hypothetical protein
MISDSEAARLVLGFKLCQILTTFVAAIVFHGCAPTSDQRFHVDTRSALSERQVRNLAIREIQKRGLPLPKTCDVQLRDSFTDYEFEPSRAIFAVTVCDLKPSKRSALYTMNIDKQSAKIEDFTDMRTGCPDPRTRSENSFSWRLSNGSAGD